MASDPRRGQGTEDSSVSGRRAPPRSRGEELHARMGRALDQGGLRDRVRGPGDHRDAIEVTCTGAARSLRAQGGTVTIAIQTEHRRDWRDIAGSLFKLGATSYGGPAIMGIMQAELQEKRKWVSKERFLEGLSVANMLPGATATQLGIFLGYARGGWWGGLVGGLCFVVPAFVIMLALTMAYASVGVTPIARGALYGLGPVVLALFGLAVYRLGRSAAG